MQRVNLKVAMAFVLGAVLAGGISLAFAQSFGAPSGQQRGVTMQRGMSRGFSGGFRRSRFRQGPVGAVVADLNGIQRLYLLEGQHKNIADLYQYVLSKTQNPMLRNYAYRRLARSEIKVTNADQAIATLRQSLNENLARVNQFKPAKP